MHVTWLDVSVTESVWAALGDPARLRRPSPKVPAPPASRHAQNSEHGDSTPQTFLAYVLAPTRSVRHAVFPERCNSYYCYSYCPVSSFLLNLGRVLFEGRGLRVCVEGACPVEALVVPDEVVAAIVADTLCAEPPDGAGCWSTRQMAARHGVGKDFVAQTWRERGLRPWLADVFKVSADPDFEAKLADVIGLYVDPPERAVVFSFDEKTQIQALDRTQPSLRLRPGRNRTMTHDYKRNGTIDLFAALNVATGEVLHQTRKRWHLHFTPTSSSWANLVEGWFSILTRKALKTRAFTSVGHLTEVIEHWTAHWNHDPQPLKWTKTADQIIAKVKRARTALNKTATHH